MPAHDASLASWPDLNQRHPCNALLLGNGASRALWKPFGYFSLYEEAQRAGRKKGLAISDQALFKSLGTELFEPVLSTLNHTVRANAALAINSTAPLNRYYSIKEGLIHAIRTLHLPWPLMPAATLASINQALREYRTVYTSNYDLILPWALQQDPQGFAALFDEQGFFDVRRTRSEGTRVLHLHGGLHLLKLPDGSTRQRSAESAELLDGFAVNIPGEVPLFVNEERSDEKLRAIRNSDYLAWGLGQLAQESQGMCLFGQHLDSTDQHLVEAIRQARPAHLSIAIRPLSEASVLNQKQHFVERFGDMTGTALHFFDASTHPLGLEGLAIEVPSARR
ncbi:TPA: DUF4917 family protein [Pseudomonas putida]|uniref:DUF4917 family protein n=1 Tax=Pseudomonas TaxID=286 RepID=UPI00048A10E8|nr:MULTISPECIES: DUF4917 family protein [Pseudomonas]MDD2151617.1 DUF4917 family protein [Pseudomonas putida]RAS24149.1 uncharacterized protein DUF4917 [Pseudomonas sp. URMO17WK12:I7]SMF34812.1 protein of unknown function [Pseudomonas sp. URMO17WK12:I5]HDS1681080.1 DUF4917 family protein [Pseudomonas putida]